MCSLFFNMSYPVSICHLSPYNSFNSIDVAVSGGKLVIRVSISPVSNGMFTILKFKCVISFAFSFSSLFFTFCVLVAFNRISTYSSSVFHVFSFFFVV